MNRRRFLSLFGIGASCPLLGLYPQIGNAFPVAQIESSASSQSAAQFVDPFENVSWPKISLIACGGAGFAMARQIDKAKLGIHEIIAVDTSKRALNHATNADRKILLEGNGGRKPTTAHQAFQLAWQNQEAIKQAIGNPHMAIIVTGLGGSTGSGVSSVVSQLARRAGVFTLAFATQPFAFEDKYHQINSNTGLNGLVMNSDNVLTVPNDSLQQLAGPDASYAEVLKFGSNALAQYLWNTCACLTRYGMVGMDFEDVRSVLAADPQNRMGMHSSKIGWGEAEGPDRALRATRQALQLPTFAANGDVASVGISVSIRANRTRLKMKEINIVMNEIKAQCCDDETHVIFSADYDDSLDQRIQVSVIANRFASRKLGVY